MDETPPARAEAVPGKKRSLFGRVPVSLLVTLLGIALTAWLLPAFTRQWDDRQKAHDVQERLIRDMGIATARALAGGERLWAWPGCEVPIRLGVNGQAVPVSRAVRARLKKACRLGTQRFRRDSTKLVDAWLLPSVSIEASLRAYFDPKIVTAWQLYSYFVTRYDGSTQGVVTQENLLSAWRRHYNLEAAALPVVASAVSAAEQPVGNAPDFHDLKGWAVWEQLKTKVHKYMPQNQSGDALSWGETLLTFQEEITREVLRSHVSGYSTTPIDLFRDLIP